MSTISNHYAVLGVRQNASIREINAAWKSFALTYHPDKSNRENATKEFQQGLEAVETLRDPQRRQQHDRLLYQELSNTHRFRQMSRNWAGDDSCSSSCTQTWPMQDNQPRNVSKEETSHSTRQKNQDQAGPRGLTDRRKSEAPTAMNFQTAEKIMSSTLQRLDQEAEPSVYLGEDNRRRRAHSQAQMPSAEYQRAENGTKTVNERAHPAVAVDKTKEDFRQEDQRDFFDDDSSIPTETSTAAHRSNGHVNLHPAFHNDCGYKYQRATSDFGSSPGSSMQSDIPQYEEIEAQDNDEMTADPDSLDFHGGIPVHASGRPISGQDTSRTEHSSKPSAQVADDAPARWPLRQFIPYLNAKLNDHTRRYTPDDMYQELNGIVLDCYCAWLETTRISCPSASPRTTPIDQSVCPHLGLWHKEFSQHQCDACRLWKPLFTLTCSACGLKKCVRCKYSVARS